MIIMDTDTLCDNVTEQEIMVQIFKFNSNGSHKKVA